MHDNPIHPPHIVFLGAETNIGYAKTGTGLSYWRPERVVGQFCLPGCTIDLGVPNLTLEDAAMVGVRSVVLGTAPVGGSIPVEWVTHLEHAITLGLDIISGLHQKLETIGSLKKLALQHNTRLIDIRTPPKDIPVGSGKPRTGKRLLMVGTDCAVGKKYTALQLERDLHDVGINADFRATGQTGILIAGKGIPIDAVVSDFVSGAAEMTSPESSADHWDVIEGQGSIFHPGYCAVSMGLLIGSQPDGFVVCHQANRETFLGWPDFALPSISEVIDRTIDIGRKVNPSIQCVGLSINTSCLDEHERAAYLNKLSQHYQLPVVDPLIEGTKSIVQYMAGKSLFQIEEGAVQ
ncbi:DUF1611 domain-containing protein [Alteromonas sediminis]|uniref:DUF1611 domain-containing protein n=1 Tax=Alteromonas sediminis TaxID=2259342 RepID=A0A3N5Z892_9ALTE|nr:DUF1611 domain-containing protein [Alteromonas sediminis]RPJ66994.1 DUF1611 domain-containing protein [Alteromonas sediminis]